MTDATFSDEQLSAFIDGELSDAENAAIVRAAEADTALAARIAILRDANSHLRDAIDDLLGEAPRTLLPSDNLVPFPQRRSARADWMRMAAAAGVAFVIGAIAMRTIAPSPQQTMLASTGDGVVARATLAAALDRAHSGDRSDSQNGTVVVSASFVAKDTRFCREFHVDFASGAADGVACRDASGWRIEGWSNAPKSVRGYETAGGPNDAVMSATIDRLGTREMLDRAGEEKAIGVHWHQR